MTFFTGSDKIFIMNHLAIIGGSGLYDIENLEVTSEHEIETPFGWPSDQIKEIVTPSGKKAFFLARHGQNHQFAPSEINYRANVYALKKLGCRYICSFSAAGSLREEIKPGDFAIVEQYIDWTKAKRARSFFTDGIAGHISMASPSYDPQNSFLNEHLPESTSVHQKTCYVCIEGPSLSSKAESKFYQSIGADVIGMTNLPEANLAREAGMAYSSVAMVTDFDAWKDDVPFDLNALLATMKYNTAAAKKAIANIIEQFDSTKLNYNPENKFSVITKPDSLSERQKELVNLLLS